MINDKTFEHKPIGDLMAIVKNDFRKLDSEGLIEEGRVVKTVLYCNDKLGIGIREIRQIAVEVNEFKAKLPLDFEKLYYVCALNVSNTKVRTSLVNPFDNSFDEDIIWDAELDRESLGNKDNYMVKIIKPKSELIVSHGQWIELNVDAKSEPFCHTDCPNRKGRGKYTVHVADDQIEVPFRAGTLYIMYIGAMKNAEGEITFPFHPMITPWYEWMVKEKILSDAIFNSDATNLGELYKLAQSERIKAWLDAFNFTYEKGYGEYVDYQRKKELLWYNQYFKFFQ